MQREQAHTFQRLEKKRASLSIRTLGRTENFKDFRHHLTGLLLVVDLWLCRGAALAFGRSLAYPDRK